MYKLSLSLFERKKNCYWKTWAPPPSYNLMTHFSPLCPSGYRTRRSCAAAAVRTFSQPIARGEPTWSAPGTAPRRWVCRPPRPPWPGTPRLGILPKRGTPSWAGSAPTSLNGGTRKVRGRAEALMTLPRTLSATASGRFAATDISLDQNRLWARN